MFGWSSGFRCKATPPLSDVVLFAWGSQVIFDLFGNNGHLPTTYTKRGARCFWFFGRPMEVAALRFRVKILEYLAGFLFCRLSSRSDENRSYKFQHRKGFAWRKEFPKGVRGYPECQRLFMMSGYRFKVTCKVLLLVASAFGRPKISRPAADTEAFRSPHARNNL